jgi:hypothetical protein
MDRGNHYERAFAAYVRERGLLTLGVDESRRGWLGETSVKNLDLLVVGPGEVRLAVDVKGRRYPSGPAGKRRYTWECWSTAADVAGLTTWTDLLGDGYVGLLVFVYHVLPEVRLPEETLDLWEYQERTYLFRAVPVEDYRRHLRVRSPRWGTVGLARHDYVRVVRPVSDFLGDGDDIGANARERECWSAS